MLINQIESRFKIQGTIILWKALYEIYITKKKIKIDDKTLHGVPDLSRLISFTSHLLIITDFSIKNILYNHF